MIPILVKSVEYLTRIVLNYNKLHIRSEMHVVSLYSIQIYIYIYLYNIHIYSIYIYIYMYNSLHVKLNIEPQPTPGRDIPCALCALYPRRRKKMGKSNSKM